MPKGLEAVPFDAENNFSYSNLPDQPKVDTSPSFHVEIEDLECDRRPVQTNRYGIVIPPPVMECMGEECKFRKSQPKCLPNRHHLHSTEPFYEKAGTLATKFRELGVITAWMHECRHTDYHGQHYLDVPVPDRDVMEQAMYEASLLDRIVANYHETRAVSNILIKSKLSEAAERGLSRKRETLLSKRKELQKGTYEIEVIPEELVTGALLIVASNHARARIFEGSSFVLTGTMAKKDIPVALRIGKRTLSDAMLHAQEQDTVVAAA